LIAAGLLAVAIAVTVVLGGVFSGASGAADVAMHLVYTASTTNDSSISLPTEVKADLEKAGLANQSVALTRIDSTGQTTDSIIDLTPRSGDSPKDPVLKVVDRAIPVIDAKITAIEKTINSSSASSGNRALYAGLTKIDFTGVPTVIVSSGIDLASPDDYRQLKWSVPAQDVVASVKKAGAEAALHGPVTFVMVPTTGAQAQLGEAQREYRERTWNALLTSAGATSVRFLDAAGTATASATPAPTVPVPDLPGTPIPPKKSPADARQVTCTLPASYFVVNTPILINREKTKKDLTTCVADAMASNATFALDGWTSYVGPLDAAGKPTIDSPENRKLSRERVDTIVGLLIKEFGVPPTAITDRIGHGNTDQPDPDPKSPRSQAPPTLPPRPLSSSGSTTRRSKWMKPKAIRTTAAPRTG
jgi:hypothetical protein